VAVLVAFCLIIILSVTALAIDGGRILAERRNVQAAADAAALAAAADLYDNYWTNSGADPSHTARDSAWRTSKANGFENGVNATVTVNIPPTTGDYVGQAGYVEVLVQYKEARSFSNLFSSTAIDVGARAVAIGSPVAADVGILVLNPTAKGAFSTSGGGTSQVVGTPIVVNSSNSEAAIAGGTGSVTALEFDITGGYSTTGSGSFVGPIHLGRRPMVDPLKDLPIPDKANMTKQSNKKIQQTSGDVSLQPGVYKGGISVSGTGNLNLAPGVYYMDGGGFSFSGQGSLNGPGVMIYNDPGNGNSDGISVSGQGSLILSAPTSGVYQGLTFFQDRTSGVSGNVSGSGGGGTTSIKGTFYFAGADLSVSGNGGVSNVGSQYISDTLILGGNGGIKVDWKPNEVARMRHVGLVE